MNHLQVTPRGRFCLSARPQSRSRPSQPAHRVDAQRPPLAPPWLSHAATRELVHEYQSRLHFWTSTAGLQVRLPGHGTCTQTGASGWTHMRPHRLSCSRRKLRVGDSCCAGDGITSVDIPACCSLLPVGGHSTGRAIPICTFRRVLCDSLVVAAMSYWC